uniref:Ras and EF-hand domain-containing protein n=1 Tax=Ditylenchus dipsaci TaxID=166011 RepID=A0A915E010_9BILA
MEVVFEEEETIDHIEPAISIRGEQPAAGDSHAINAILHEQAVRLFELCDLDQKGFIVRADLEQLNCFLPVHQLEHFFDTNDKQRVNVVNRNNFLRGIKPILMMHNINNNNNNNNTTSLKDRRKAAVKQDSLVISQIFDNSSEKKKPPQLILTEITPKATRKFNSISLEDDGEHRHSNHTGTTIESNLRPPLNWTPWRLTDYEGNAPTTGLAKFYSLETDSRNFESSPPATPNRRHNQRQSSRRTALGSKKRSGRGRPPFSAQVVPSPVEKCGIELGGLDLAGVCAPPPPPPYIDYPQDGDDEEEECHSNVFDSPPLPAPPIARQLSQPVNYEDSRSTTTHFLYDYEDEKRLFNKRNHNQFAQVIERASISHSDLSMTTCSHNEESNFRLAACENSLADEMREASRKYKGTADLDLRTPDRIFKVVFVGDSAVGKTCFLHRFCHNRFKPLFNATIGVDFTVKTIRLQDRLVAVQLWDTAGQERFRSITKQYFRKADGVVLIVSKSGVDDGCVMCLVGNKVDLYPNEHCRSVTYQHGKALAEEFDMIFFETSAYTGLGINDCMRALAFRLQQREQEHLEEALKLEMLMGSCKSSWCCV